MEHAEEMHIGGFNPSAERHVDFRFEGSDGESVFVEALVDRPNDPEEPLVARALIYQDGRFMDAHEVVLPERIQETKPVELNFTKRHKRALEAGAALLTVTVAAGTLIVRHRRKQQ